MWPVGPVYSTRHVGHISYRGLDLYHADSGKPVTTSGGEQQWIDDLQIDHDLDHHLTEVCKKNQALPVLQYMVIIVQCSDCGGP